MRQITLDLPEDVYLMIETRAAIDNLRAKEGIEKLLVYMAERMKEKRPV